MKTMTKEDLDGWKTFVSQSKLQAIPIPIFVTIGGVTITGVIYLRDPVEDSSAEGVIAGAINGRFNLDKRHTKESFYDPTKHILRLDIIFDSDGLRVVLYHRKWIGGWKKFASKTIWKP